MSEAVATRTLARRPYKGLSPFDDSEHDALLFFGREREREVIVANILASRLTVLYGPSGVGKSSILRAGVARRLRSVAPGAAVVLHDAWSGKPAAALRSALARELGPLPAGALADALGHALRASGETLYLILDQCEEAFVYRDAERALAADLPELAGRPGLPVHVLLSIREDSLARLDAFKAELPSLFANVLRLDRLDRAAGTAAILGPVEQHNRVAGPDEQVRVESELVERVLDETAAGRVELGGAGRGGLDAAGDERVEAPYLQLVMERLWEAERRSGSSVLRLETLDRLGGAAAIVRDHLERALEGLAPADRDLAARMFNHLVTPSGTKIAYDVADLAQYAEAPEVEVAPVLSALGRERIVRAVDGAADGMRFEIFHDVLAGAVLAWRTRRELERQRQAAERRHRRLLLVAGIAVAVAVAMAAVTAFALSERSRARAHARLAQARELEAVALGGLQADPQSSLAMALRAARLAPDPRAEEVLQRALIAARLRAVLPAPKPVFGVRYSPDGRLALATSTRGARVYDAADRSLVRVLRGSAPTTDAVFTDDRRVLTATSDGVARLRDARTGRVLSSLRGRGAVTAVASARGGRLLLVARTRGPVQVADAHGRVVALLPEPGPTTLGELDPSGRLAVTVARDARGAAKARVFDVSGARLLRVLPNRDVRAVSFSPAGSLLAVAGGNGTTTLWRPRRGRPLRVLFDGPSSIAAEAFSPDGKLLATSSDDGAVRVWAVASGRRIDAFTGHTGHSLAVAWSPDGRLVADGSSDQTARVWAVRGLVEKGELVATLAGDTGEVTSVAFRPHGFELLTGSRDGTARLWDAHPEEALRLVGRHDGPVASAALSPDGRRVVSAGADGSARIWDLRSRRLVRVLRNSAPLLSAAWGDAGTEILTVDGREARLWTPAGRPLRRFRPGARLRAAALSPDGQTVLLAAGRALELRDARTGRERARLPTAAPVVAAALDPDGERVAAADGLGDVGAWSADGRPLWRHRVPGCSIVAFSPDGRTVAAACGVEARLWDAATGRSTRVVDGRALTKPLTAVVFSPDGRTLLTTDATGGAHLWDVRSGRQLHDLVGQFGRIAAAAFSPDGRWILTAGPIAAILWSAESGRLVFYLRGHRLLLTSVSFAPDGRRVLTSSLDGTVRTYLCTVCGDLDALERLAEARLREAAPRR